MFQFIVDNFTALQGRGKKCVAFLFATCSVTALSSGLHLHYI